MGPGGAGEHNGGVCRTQGLRQTSRAHGGFVSHTQIPSVLSLAVDGGCAKRIAHHVFCSLQTICEAKILIRIRRQIRNPDRMRSIRFSDVRRDHGTRDSATRAHVRMHRARRQHSRSRSQSLSNGKACRGRERQHPHPTVQTTRRKAPAPGSARQLPGGRTVRAHRARRNRSRGPCGPCRPPGRSCMARAGRRGRPRRRWARTDECRFMQREDRGKSGTHVPGGAGRDGTTSTRKH